VRFKTAFIFLKKEMNKRFVNTMGGRREGECVAVLPAVFNVFLEALNPLAVFSGVLLFVP
jgi:hypothetical protein